MTGRGDSGPALQAGPVPPTGPAEEAPVGVVPAARVGGRLVFGAACVALLAISVPVLVRGALLADDFNNCLAPQQKGLLGFMGESFERLGLIRPARFVEILLTTGVCQTLPFGVAIGVTLSLTVVVALLLRRLLKALGAPPPWPDVAAAVWLLQPLGAEAALWPAALHVPLGLAAALGALLAVRGGRIALGALLGIAAMLSVEQTILALPLAAWLVASPDRRRRAAVALAAGSAAVAVADLLVPGNDPRLSAGMSDRTQELFTDLGFLLRFPAVGFGAESIPLAVRWAFPLSVLALVAGAVAGWRWAARSWPPVSPRVRPWGVRSYVAVVVLAALVNAPVLLSVPRQGSPRIFTPTWLLLAGVAALWLGQARIRRRTLWGALAGLYLTGAVLSLALSSWVRIGTATVVKDVAHEIAARTTDRDNVRLCDVPRAAVSPAPRGAFAVQDYLYDWAAADALRYHTGRIATFQIHARDSAEDCPSGGDVVVLRFDELAGGDD